MTLLEILVKELKEWPEGVEMVTQSLFGFEIYDAKTGVPADYKSFIPAIRTITRHKEAGYPLVTKGQWLMATGKTPEQLRTCAYSIRDTIIELEAYEEKFRRERGYLIEKLRIEGFSLLKLERETGPAEDLGNPNLWQAGDWVECTFSASGCYSEGQCYQVEYIKDGMIAIRDNDNSNISDSWCTQPLKNVTSKTGVESGFKFHRRGVL